MELSAIWHVCGSLDMRLKHPEVLNCFEIGYVLQHVRIVLFVFWLND